MISILITSFRNEIYFVGFFLFAFIFSCSAQIDSSEYTTLRHYNTANKYRIQYYYLETKARLDKEGLIKTADKFHSDLN